MSDTMSYRYVPRPSGINSSQLLMGFAWLRSVALDRRLNDSSLAPLGQHIRELPPGWEAGTVGTVPWLCMVVSRGPRRDAAAVGAQRLPPRPSLRDSRGAGFGRTFQDFLQVAR